MQDNDDMIIPPADPETPAAPESDEKQSAAARINKALNMGDDERAAIKAQIEAQAAADQAVAEAEIAREWTGDIAEDAINVLLAKDWSSFSPDDLPDPPDGYRFSYVKEGEGYVRRLVPEEAPLAYVAKEIADDGFSLCPSAYSGKWSDKDFRWVAPNTNPVDTQMSVNAGFVPVKEHIDPKYVFEGQRVRNGDLVLYYRPREVTEQRALEMARQTQNAINQPFQDWMDQETDKTVTVEGSMVTNGRAASYEEKMQQTALSIEEQLREQSSRARGKKTFAVSAPFQRNIINGKEYTDAEVAALRAVGGRV